MTFEPAPFSDGRRALAACLLVLVLIVILARQVLTRPMSPATFFLLLLALILLLPAAYLAWRAWACLTLIYWVDRNGVTVAWGPMRQVIPLGQILQVQRGMGEAPQPRWLDRWPKLRHYMSFGPDLATVRHLGEGPVTSLASRNLAEQLLLATPQGRFGISPADPAAFLQALEEHHALGPTHLLSLERHLPRLYQAAIWRNRWGQGLLLAGFAGCLVLLGILMVRAPALAPGTGKTLALLPAFGLAVWLVNGLWGLLVHRQQRVASGLLWAGTLAVQAGLLVALLRLTA